jgi:hypothetical protein
MDISPRHHAPDLWLGQIFAAKAVASGGVIRRNRRWVEDEIGRDRFVAEVQRRGFHLLETGDQLIVVCHCGPIRMHF